MFSVSKIGILREKTFFDWNSNWNFKFSKFHNIIIECKVTLHHWKGLDERKNNGISILKIKLIVCEEFKFKFHIEKPVCEKRRKAVLSLCGPRHSIIPPRTLCVSSSRQVRWGGWYWTSPKGGQRGHYALGRSAIFGAELFKSIDENALILPNVSNYF